MKPFTGQATLHAQGHRATVLLSLDMETGSFEVEMPNGSLPPGALEQQDGEAKDFSLTDVRIHLPSGTLLAERLTGMTHGCNQTTTTSITTSPLSMALNLADDRSGTVTLALRPKSAMIHLRHEPPLTDSCELYYLNNFVDHTPMTIPCELTTFHFQPRRSSLSVSAPIDIREYSKRIGTAWSIFQGAHVAHTASYWSSEVDLAVRKPRPYRRGHHFFRGWSNANDLLEKLLHMFLRMDDDEFAGWSKAVRFYLEGINDDLDYDVRIVNFMVFIEMFDQAATMNRQMIADTFAVSTELAELVVKMRNKLVHERMTIWSALPRVHAEIVQYQPQWRCPEIDFSSNNFKMLPILFFLHLERMVNSFIARTLQYSGGYNDCSGLIRSIERKMA